MSCFKEYASDGVTKHIPCDFTIKLIKNVRGSFEFKKHTFVFWKEVVLVPHLDIDPYCCP